MIWRFLVCSQFLFALSPEAKKKLDDFIATASPSASSGPIQDLSDLRVRIERLKAEVDALTPQMKDADERTKRWQEQFNAFDARLKNENQTMYDDEDWLSETNSELKTLCCRLQSDREFARKYTRERRARIQTRTPE